MSILTQLQMSEIPVEYDGLGYRGQNYIMLEKAGVPDPTILVGVKSWLSDRVDAAAEAQREAVLTPGAGQAMEYQEVNAQATAALADASATSQKYPMLAASIGIDIDPITSTPASDVLGVARAVAARYAAWQTLGAAIRAERLKGKWAIAAATSLDAAVAAYDAIAWPSLSS